MQCPRHLWPRASFLACGLAFWLAQLAQAAPGWPPWCAIEPEHPGVTDRVTITLGSDWSSSCVPAYPALIRVGNSLYFDLTVDYPPEGCLDVITPWSQSETVGPLPAGEYTVLATLYDSSPVEGPDVVGHLTVPSGDLFWGSDLRLTHDDTSDSAPAAVVHDDELNVLWNQSYEGTVHRGVLAADGWDDLGEVSDCATGGGPGAASYQDSLYVFYPQGAFPVFHLFGQNLSDGSPPFALNSGDVDERYGAACAVYNGELHVFWERWQGGTRVIRSRSFDGTRWTEPVVIATNDAADSRPAVAAFGGHLFLFYLGGSRYKSFDGTTWSDEAIFLHRADWNTTPAACAYGNKLIVFVVENELIRAREFDGTTWSPFFAVPASPVDEPRDLAVAVRGSLVYLFWSSWYSWDRSELYVKVGTGLAADFDVDGDVDHSDFDAFEACSLGPAVPHVGSPICDRADFDHDHDVDQLDFAVFQRCLSGEAISADPTCAD